MDDHTFREWRFSDLRYANQPIPKQLHARHRLRQVPNFSPPPLQFRLPTTSNSLSSSPSKSPSCVTQPTPTARNAFCP